MEDEREVLGSALRGLTAQWTAGNWENSPVRALESWYSPLPLRSTWKSRLRDWVGVGGPREEVSLSPE